jgi:serine O-acetyltransferase
MDLSLNIPELVRYTTRQLHNFFPDEGEVLINEQIVNSALKRLDFCFSHVKLAHYFDGINTKFNHLFSDHYVMFLWYLANEIFIRKGRNSTSNKLYYLNKSLNGLDCMYDTAMPKVFLIFHGVGTMLGKAKYGEFFVALHGCTIGSQKNHYPIIGKGVIGNCTIGDRVTVSSRTIIFERDISSDNTVFIDTNTGALNIKNNNSCYAQQFFNIDLNKL